MNSDGFGGDSSGCCVPATAMIRLAIHTRRRRFLEDRQEPLRFREDSAVAWALKVRDTGGTRETSSSSSDVSAAVICFQPFRSSRLIGSRLRIV
mgnify:CR=1 FL=1